MFCIVFALHYLCKRDSHPKQISAYTRVRCHQHLRHPALPAQHKADTTTHQPRADTHSPNERDGILLLLHLLHHRMAIPTHQTRKRLLQHLIRKGGIPTRARPQISHAPQALRLVEIPPPKPPITKTPISTHFHLKPPILSYPILPHPTPSYKLLEEPPFGWLLQKYHRQPTL